MSLAPPKPLAGGTLFWENLSLESLVEEDLSLLIGRAAGAAGGVGPSSSSATRPPPPPQEGEPSTSSSKKLKRAASKKRPTSIALPSPPRLPAAAKPSSPLSPKLYSWNFLRRNNGAHTTPASPAPASQPTTTGKASSGLPANRQVEVASAPRKHRRSLALPPGTTFELEETRLKQAAAAVVTSAAASASASAVQPSKPQRPGQSRSSTWTDNLPTVRTLNHSQDPGHPAAHPEPTASSSSARANPFVEDPVLLVPIVSPRKDNLARGGRFGLFRRGSLSPRVEKTGFTIGGRPSEDKDLPGKQRKKTSKDSLEKAAKRKHRGSFGSFTSLGGARPSSPLSWGPRAEELRHVALTTASPPPEEAQSVSDFEPGSLSSDAASLRSYFTAAPLSSDPPSRHGVLPRSALHSSDLHQLSQSPSTSAVCQSPLRQSLDLPKPHITFGAPPAPASPLRTSVATFPQSHSESSLSLQTSDSDEDFPTRSGARKAVKTNKLRKPPVMITRDRSCSPLRYASDVEGLDSQGEDGRGRLKAWQWWRPSSSGTTSPSSGARGRPSSTVLGSSAPTPSSSADRAKRGKSASSKVSQRGFQVTSRPISSLETAAQPPTADGGFLPTPPPSIPSLNPTPAPDRSASGTREPSPIQQDSLLTASRPPPFTRQSTGNVSVRSSAVLREWQPPAKAPPAPPPDSHRALPPVNTSAPAPAVRKDSLSPPSGSSFGDQSPISAYGTATEGDETTNSEQELGTTEDGSCRQAWQPKIQSADSERSWDSDSILHRVESQLGGPAATKA